MLDTFGEWIEKEHRSVLPKSPLGQAIGYTRNQWPSLSRYLTYARFTIYNNVAERAVRPLAVGRKNWLFIGGDCGLPTASVLLNLCASAKRHSLNPWAYLIDVLTRMSAKPTDLGRHSTRRMGSSSENMIYPPLGFEKINALLLFSYCFNCSRRVRQ